MSGKAVLAVDVGGSHVKVMDSEGRTKREFVSGPHLSASEMVRERRDCAGVKITCEPDPALPRVMADRIQLEQVLNNLIANGAQATAGCAMQEVRVTAVNDGDRILVSVADTGAGIPADVRENLFEPFRTTKEKGLGLGLPICRTIIEAHGGRLWTEANAPQGSIFHFTLTKA